MFNIQVLTLFPELFEPFQRCGLVSRAIDEHSISFAARQLRDFAINTHGQVDDTPYGGGSGMVLRCESASAAINAAKQNDPGAKVVLFTPRGKVFTQRLAREIASDCQTTGRGLILLCSRYEGVDERICEKYVDLEICMGDYILMGGEVPAMAFTEAITRLLPGVLNNPESIVQESFEQPMLEYPQFTKPAEFEGQDVPAVLLSGNHAEIEKWRASRAMDDTKHRRPDLLREPITPAGELSVALIHYPVLDKRGDIITSSITNIDVHDIARSSRTFGLARFYVVHPVKLLRKLVQKICDHWETGYGLQYNPNRSDALSKVSLVPDFDDVLLDIESRTGKMPKIIASSARPHPKNVSAEELRRLLMTDADPHLLLLGTGWGLSPQMMDRATYYLEPIVGPTDYNHLSVRAAAAIMFHELLGKR